MHYFVHGLIPGRRGLESQSGHGAHLKPEHQQKGVSCYGPLSYMTYIVYHDQTCSLWQKTY